MLLSKGDADGNGDCDYDDYVNNNHDSTRSTTTMLKKTTTTMKTKQKY